MEQLAPPIGPARDLGALRGCRLTGGAHIAVEQGSLNLDIAFQECPVAPADLDLFPIVSENLCQPAACGRTKRGAEALVGSLVRIDENGHLRVEGVNRLPLDPAVEGQR